MSASRSHATTEWNSAFSLPLPTYSFVATENVVTFFPLASTRSSGSRVRRPVSRTLFIGPIPPGRPGLRVRPCVRAAGDSAGGGIGPMTKVLLTGRLTRDPELRVLASGKNVTTFSLATNEYVGNGKEKAEFHSVVTWDRLADICASYLGKGMTVALEGRIQTRQWDDDRGAHHWKTEIVAAAVEMLSGRRKKDYAADALAVQANALGVLG